jgi:hypothetical protein
MMQLYRHSGKTCFSHAQKFSATFSSPEQAGHVYITQQSIVNKRLCGISDLLPQGMRVIGALPGQREWSQPISDVTEGFMTLAADMRPEATLLIGFSQSALQRPTRILYELTHQNLHWHSICWSLVKSMMHAT